MDNIDLVQLWAALPLVYVDMIYVEYQWLAILQILPLMLSVAKTMKTYLIKACTQYY